MNKQYGEVLCNSSISCSNVHVGDNYFESDSKRKTAENDRRKYSVEDLIEKKPILSMICRFLVCAGSFAVDFVTVWMADRVERSTIGFGVSVAIFLLFAIIGLVSLCTSLLLLLDGRLFNARRIGCRVYRITTQPCPICDRRNYDGKLRLKYNGDPKRRDGEGDYVVCSNDSRHYWYVTFPKEKKQSK